MEFKTIEKFPKYEVNRRGEVRHRGTGATKKPLSNAKGYLRVVLYTEKGVRLPQRVHRLVAQTFIPNPDSKSQVNHKDGNKQNNDDTNLEWVTNDENKEHAEQHNLVAKQRKAVVQYSIEGEYVQRFESLTSAAKSVNGHRSPISYCCKGIQKTSYGYVWRYEDGTTNTNASRN